MFDSAANCFLNALVREFEQWEYAKLPPEITQASGCTYGFRCILNGEQSIYLPLIEYSNFGRSYFFHKQYSYNHTDKNFIKYGFSQFLQLLGQHLKIFTDSKLGKPQLQNLLKVLHRAQESTDNINKVLAHRRSDIEPIYNQDLNFIDSEQSLLVGHSIHPCPKSRSGFNEHDERLYVPEYANEFQLHWFAVDKEILFVFAGNETSLESYCHDLVVNNPELKQLANSLKSNFVLIPCHPWQANHWQANKQLAEYFAKQQLIDLGLQGPAWRATSSLRSLYQADTPWMLKFSISTQLTNSIRHLQPEEMIRGQIIEKVLSSDKFQKMEQEISSFRIMREPISIALKGSDGEALDSTAIIWRQNPFYQDLNSPRSTEVLSGLLQDLPGTPDNRLSLRIKALANNNQSDPSHLARAFLRKFLQVVIKPIIIAQAKYGLLFGAHQQNIVITFDPQLMPIKAYFRDCQGTGFSSLARELYGEELLSETINSANLFENDTVIQLFAYYLMLNSCFNTISSLTLPKLLSEEAALDIYREFLLQLKADSLPDPRVINYLLDSEYIWSKGNFFCNLHDINENTMDDPFSIYHRLKNPLKASITSIGSVA